MVATENRHFSRITLQTVSMIAGKIVALLATFSMPLILTRLLSKSEYGVFAQFYVVVFFCTGFFSLAVQSNLYYYYPTETVQRRKTLVFQTLVFLLLSAFLAAGLVSFPGVGKFLIGEGDLMTYRKFILAGIFLLMPVMIIEPLYVLRKDIVTSLAYPPSEVLLRLSLVIGFILMTPGLNSVFTGIIISASICLVFVLIYSFKEIGIKGIGRNLISMKLAKSQLKYSLPFGMAVSLNIFFQRFDKIICISFLTPSDFAIYAIAFYGVPGIFQVYDSLSQVYLIQMTVKHQENKTQELIDIYKSLVTKTFSFSLPVITVVMLYAYKIITFLFTRNYADAVPLFRAYLFSFLIFMLSSGLILRATGKTNLTLRSYFLSGLVIVPSTYFLIKHFGIWGAMTGALIGISLPKLLNLAAEIRLLNSNLKTFFPWKKFALIGAISFVTIIPFVFLEYMFDYGIFVTALMGLIYLLIVSVLELKYNIFALESATVRTFLQARFGFLTFGLFKK